MTEIIKVDEIQNHRVLIPYGEEAIQKGTKLSKQLNTLIEKQKLYVNIAGKKYVKCEGWTTLGAILGLIPRIVEVREIKTDFEKKYIAVCEIWTLDGKLITRAEAQCSNLEENKKKQDDYALMSMAQTRAVSKAFRLILSWVMTLAGYESTPYEEIEPMRQTIEQEVKIENEPPKKGTQKEDNVDWYKKAQETIWNKKIPGEYIEKVLKENGLKQLADLIKYPEKGYKIVNKLAKYRGK